jgi:hypothetical protein
MPFNKKKLHNQNFLFHSPFQWVSLFALVSRPFYNRTINHFLTSLLYFYDYDNMLILLSTRIKILGEIFVYNALWSVCTFAQMLAN